MSKKSRMVKSFISNNVEGILLGMFCMMMVFYTVENLSMSQAKDDVIKHVVNDRSPAIVEMYMAHHEEESEEE